MAEADEIHPLFIIMALAIIVAAMALAWILQIDTDEKT